MKNIKKYLPWTLRIIIAFLFLISAVAKMYPSPYFAISTFEVKQLYPMGFSEDVAVYFSRILIGLELALGLLLLQPNYLRRFVIPSTMLMLLVFTTHLTIDTILNGGNSGNCGCFGSLLPMTPIEAIIKNVVAMALLAYLFYLLPKPGYKGNFWILTTVALASVLAVFMLAPIQPKVVDVLPVEETLPAQTIETEFPVDTTATPPVVTKSDTVKKTEAAPAIVKPTVEEPAVHKSGYTQYFANIDKGKKILCFFVPGCDHCREVAKELTEMKRKDKNFPAISIVFMNEEADLIPDFFKFAGAEYPYKVIEIIPFWKVLGSGKDTPGVKYLWNGNEMMYYWGITEDKFSVADFQSVLKKTYPELKKK